MTELAQCRVFESVLISVNLWLKKTNFSHRFTQISLIFVDSENHWKWYDVD